MIGQVEWWIWTASICRAWWTTLFATQNTQRPTVSVIFCNMRIKYSKTIFDLWQYQLQMLANTSFSVLLTATDVCTGKILRLFRYCVFFVIICIFCRDRSDISFTVILLFRLLFFCRFVWSNLICLWIKMTQTCEKADLLWMLFFL